MPVERRVDSDRVTAITHSSIALNARPDGAEQDAILEALGRSLRLSSFDGRIASAEAICRAWLRESPNESRQYGSRAWYAAEILASIERVRHAAAGRTRSWQEIALSEAVRLGYLCAEAVARHEWPDLQPGLTTARKRGGAATASRKAGSARLLVAAVEKIKKNRRLSDTAAVRLYLGRVDAGFHAGPDAERTRKTSNLLRVLSRARAKLRR